VATLDLDQLGELGTPAKEDVLDGVDQGEFEGSVRPLACLLVCLFARLLVCRSVATLLHLPHFRFEHPTVFWLLF
jgi:hypothetical protein